jgi:hypothetical protein
MQALGGMIQGGAGQIAMNQAQQAKQQQEQMDVAKLMIQAYANQNRDITQVNPGTPGALPYGKSMAFKVGDAPPNYAQLENKVQYENLRQEQENPDKANQDWAARSGMGWAVGQGGTSDILKALANINTLKTGVGPEVTGKKTFFGQAPITRQRLTDKGIITEIKNPDGSWGNGSRPAKTKFIKPSHVPQSVWDQTTDAQKEDFLNKLNAQ